MLERRSRNASGLLRFGVWRSGFGVPGLRFGIRAPLRGSDYVALQRNGSRTHIRSAPRGDHSDGPYFAWLSRSRPSHVRECVPDASKRSRLPRMAIHTSPGSISLVLLASEAFADDSSRWKSAAGTLDVWRKQQ